MKWQVIKIRVLQWLKRIILYGLFGILVFFIVAYSILQIPAVQKSIVTRITGNFSKVSGFDIQFDRFYVLWYDRLEITGLTITDPKKNSMIEADKLYVNFGLSTLIKNNDINLDVVSLDGAVVNLVTIPDSDTTKQLNIDVFIAEIGKQFSSGSSSGGGGAKFNIGEVLLNQSEFSYNITDKDSIKNGFDFNHFRLALDEGELNNFKVIGDTIEFKVESLQIKDQKTQLHVTELSTFFRISQLSMEFLGLNLNANQSHISDTVILKYKSQGDLGDLNNKVTFDIRFKNTKLDPNDVALFTTGLEKWDGPVLLNGKFKGKINHFSFKPMAIVMGSTEVNGSLEMDGLPNINETFISVNLAPSTIYAQDIAFLLPRTVNTNLKPFHKLQLKGSFLGFINDFVANGDIDTRFGKVRSDINYKILEDNIGLSSYSGQLKLSNFELGKYLNDTVTFQNVTLNGQIKGKGFNAATADFTLNGEVPSIGLLGYTYKNIRSDARFANQFFQGNLTIDDPNLKLSMKGSIDLRPGRDLINVRANLDTAQLHELRLTKEKVFLQSYVDIDTKGLELDSIVGSAVLKNTLLQLRNESITFDSIRVVSDNQKGNRSLLLRSSMADISLVGDFYYSTLFNDIQKLVKEFMLNLKNDPVAIKNYYLNKPKTDQAYQATINATFHDVNPIFQLLNVDLRTSNETLVQGEFINNSTSIMHVYTHLDSVVIAGQVYQGNEIEFNGSKQRDSTVVLAQLTVNSARQLLSKNMTTKNLFVEGIWNKDHIDFGFDIDQEGYDNSIRMKSEIDFMEDSTKIKILPSTFKILGDKWTVNDRNFMLFQGDEWNIRHLGLNNGGQSIKVNGYISHDQEKTLEVDVKDFQLSFINFFSTEKFTGLMNARIVERDFYSNMFIENELTIDSLTINKFFVGEVKGNNTRDPSSRHFNIDLTLDRLGYRIVDIKGYYDPRDEVSPLHTKAILEKANLKLVEPIVKDLFSQLDGTLTGVYNIEGSFSKPNISGEAKIENGQMMINYLKTLYKVTGTLAITPTQIQFNNFDLTDVFGSKGKLTGYIAHRSFSKMRIDLDASFTNFQLLNTNIKDNNFFYGQAYGTGNLNILGPVSNLKVSATARTNKNTKIYIPVNGTSSQDKKDFIEFTNFTDSIRKKIVKVNKPLKKELSGLTLDFNIDVTPDAYAEIIFDIKTGDIIRGRGRGDLNLQIDTKGEFNMFGPLEFTEGAYNFTLSDIINKEFNVKAGSRITWYGNPYEGNMNITASYRKLTSIAPALQNQSPEVLNDPNVKRKYPVEVILKLDGPMLSPQISFDIEAKDLPNTLSIAGGTSISPKLDFSAFKAKLDEQELKKQVFSLIILSRLSSIDAFATSGTNTLYNSVSELLSNQLSYWLSQVDQNLEIDLDLGTLDQEAFNTFQLRLSYSFLGGRLRVTKDGNFGNQTNSSQLSTIAGDWTVDYLLTPDGKFKVKMYSRSSVNQLTSSLNSQTAAVTTGASLIYTQNFNQFSDLLRSARDRRRKELEKNPPQEDPDGNKGSH